MNVPSRKRELHLEPGFLEADFVAEYSKETAKFPVEFRPVLQFVAGHLHAVGETDVLEIGPGPGWMAILLAKSHPGVHVSGIDVSLPFVEQACENAVRAGVADRVRFAVGDAAHMDGIDDATFDVVMSNQSFHYWDAPEGVLDQIARVLKPSGVFCIRDDRRDLNLLGKAQVLLGRCFLSRRIGSSWARSVSGCFTPDEAEAILERSQLRGRWEMTCTPRTLLVTGHAARAATEMPLEPAASAEG